MPHPIRYLPDVEAVLREAHAARARLIALLLRRVARGLRHAVRGLLRHLASTVPSIRS
jgi:hypothetical protein